MFMLRTELDLKVNIIESEQEMTWRIDATLVGHHTYIHAHGKTLMEAIQNLDREFIKVKERDDSIG